ncbi:HlyD family type I secretion periplasmic adaptor subunit [Porticoccaceae bacterium]|nr:HlyD family type I secretion periplasmic adaptor subunit [Porticoccaceae bacterium]
MNLFWFLKSAKTVDPATKTLDSELLRSRLTLWLTFVILTTFFVWAYNSEIDQVARAPGVVLPSSRVQIIQSQDGGMLLSFPVKAGQEVQRGDVLALFDATSAEADFKEALAKVSALSSRLSRLNAEVFEAQLVFPEVSFKHPQFIDNESALFRKRMDAQKEELDALGAILALVREEIDMNMPLVESGDVSKTEILRLRRQEAELVAQATNTRNEYFKDAQEQLNQVEEELEGVKQALVQRERQLQQKTLLSPVRGIVKNIRITTVGGIIRPGEEVLEVVPIEADFLIEAKLSPADIGFVTVGQNAAVKVDAFDYTIYGDLAGTITYISPDTLKEKSPQGDVPYYKVQVRTNGKVFSGAPARNFEIIPGMTATVEVHTGKNTILNYLLKPITKTLAESLGER